jgi:hypothetical protein
VQPEKTARLVLQLQEQATRVGLELRLVGSPELSRVLKQLADTADVTVFPSVADAQAGPVAARPENSR